MFAALEKDIRLILTTFIEPHEAEQIATILVSNVKDMQKRGLFDIRVIEDIDLLLRQQLKHRRLPEASEAISQHAIEIIHDLICERLNLLESSYLDMQSTGIDGEAELDELLRQATAAVSKEYSQYWRKEMKSFSALHLDKNSQEKERHYRRFEQKFHQRLQRALNMAINNTLNSWCLNHDRETLRQLDFPTIKSMALFDAASSWQTDTQTSLRQESTAYVVNTAPARHKGSVGRIR